MRISAILAAVVFCTPALAEDPYQPHGDNAFGPYATNPALTTGAIQGFRTLYASPEAIKGSLKPVAARATSGVHVLEIENTALSSVIVRVNETKVGVLGPLTFGRIHDVGAGDYTVKMTHTTDYDQVQTLTTKVVKGTEGSGNKTPAPAEESPIEAPAQEAPAQD